MPAKRLPAPVPGLPPFRLRIDLACRTADPELFYDGDTDAGRALCRHCPVRKECLRWAVDNDVVHGVWGAHNPEERRAIGRELERRRHHEIVLEAASDDLPTRPQRGRLPWAWPKAKWIDKAAIPAQFAAAREYLAGGGGAQVVADRHGVAKARLWEAVTILRHAADLEQDVVDGMVSFLAVYRYAREMAAFVEQRTVREKADAARPGLGRLRLDRRP